MQAPMMPPDQLAKLKALVEKGPPPEPSSERPGRLMQMMTAFESRYKEHNKRDPKPEEYIGYLVHILDHKDWEERMMNFQQMKAIYESQVPPLIATPNFMPPKDLKLIKPGEGG